MIPVNSLTTWSVSIDLLEGMNILSLKSADASGNLSSAYPVFITLDTTAPKIQSLTAAAPTATTAVIVITASEAVTLNIIYDMQSGTNPQTVTLSPSSGVLNTQGQYVYTITLTGLTPATTYDYYVTVTDPVNKTDTSFTQSFTTPALGSPFEDPIVITGVADQAVPATLSYAHHALDDLNGDGAEEFLMLQPVGSMTNWQQNLGVFIAYSSPDGTYQPQDVAQTVPGTFLPSAGAIFALPVGDFNGDGYADIVFGSSYQLSIGTLDVSEAILFLSQSQGTREGYQLAQTVIQPKGGQNLLAGVIGYYNEGNAADFNGDGLIDLLTADATTGQYSIIYSNRGTKNYDLSMPPAVFFVSSEYPMTYPDVNGDNLSELAGVSFTSSGTTQFKLHLSPTFSGNTLDILFNGYFISMNLGTKAGGNPGDLDGNGVREIYGLVSYPYKGQSPIKEQILYLAAGGSILRSQDTVGIWTTPNVWTTSGSRTGQALRTGDMNADGIEDIAFLVANLSTPTQALAGRAVIYYSWPTGFDFQQVPDIILDLPPNSVNEAGLGSEGHLIRRPLIVGGQVKNDLILRALNANQTAYVDLLYRER